MDTKTFKLSSQELNVLLLLTQGFENDEIAKIMNISVHTTKAHVGSIIKKLNAKNRTHAVSIALTNNIIPFLN